MKKILYIICFFALALAGCLKDKTINSDGLGKIGTLVEIQDAGSDFFSDAAVIGADTIKTFVVNLASINTLSSDLTITVGLNDSARTAYNAANGTNYQKIPDSIYSLSVKTGVIKAGTRQVTFTVKFFASKFDPATSYLGTISILNAQGQTISGNFGTIYYHIIGNPLAGNYTTTGNRYNYTGAVTWAGPPAPFPAGYTDGTTTAYSGTVTASPVDAQTVKLVFGNVPDPAPVGGSAYYYITASADFSSITYNFGSNFAAGYSNIVTYVVSYTKPTATQKASFHLTSKYNNTTGGAGSDRLIDQTFVHQ